MGPLDKKVLVGILKNIKMWFPEENACGCSLSDSRWTLFEALILKRSWNICVFIYLFIRFLKLFLDDLFNLFCIFKRINKCLKRCLFTVHESEDPAYVVICCLFGERRDAGIVQLQLLFQKAQVVSTSNVLHAADFCGHRAFLTKCFHRST